MPLKPPVDGDRGTLDRLASSGWPLTRVDAVHIAVNTRGGASDDSLGLDHKAQDKCFRQRLKRGTHLVIGRAVNEILLRELLVVRVLSHVLAFLLIA